VARRLTSASTRLVKPYTVTKKVITKYVLGLRNKMFFNDKSLDSLDEEVINAIKKAEKMLIKHLELDEDIDTSLEFLNKLATIRIKYNNFLKDER